MDDALDANGNACLTVFRQDNRALPRSVRQSFNVENDPCDESAKSVFVVTDVPTSIRVALAIADERTSAVRYARGVRIAQTIATQRKY